MDRDKEGPVAERWLESPGSVALNKARRCLGLFGDDVREEGREDEGEVKDGLNERPAHGPLHLPLLVRPLFCASWSSFE